MPKIKFLTHPDVVKVIPHPRPAKKFVPKWYKDMELERKCPKKLDPETEIIEDVPTIKQCMPVRDYLTTGYIIPAWADILIRKDSKNKYHSQSRIEDVGQHYSMGCSWHGIEQFKGSPLEGLSDGEKCLKLLNPWTIKTPKGYSTFFTSPFYTESDITILPAIVDTDKHRVPVNFPSVINTNECRIKRGEPLIQAIPFKRENWDSEVGVLNLAEHNRSQINYASVLNSIYTTDYWERKRFR